MYFMASSFRGWSPMRRTADEEMDTDGGPNGAEGKVTSKKADCEADRKVLLYQLTGSGGAKGQGEIVGRDRTDSKGNWSIDTSLTAGMYEAVVKRAKIEDGDEIICLGATSVTVQ